MSKDAPTPVGDDTPSRPDVGTAKNLLKRNRKATPTLAECRASGLAKFAARAPMDKHELCGVLGIDLRSLNRKIAEDLILPPDLDFGGTTQRYSFVRVSLILTPKR